MAAATKMCCNGMVCSHISAGCSYISSVFEIISHIPSLPSTIVLPLHIHCKLPSEHNRLSYLVLTLRHSIFDSLLEGRQVFCGLSPYFDGVATVHADCYYKCTNGRSKLYTWNKDISVDRVLLLHAAMLRRLSQPVVQILQDHAGWTNKKCCRIAWIGYGDLLRRTVPFRQGRYGSASSKLCPQEQTMPDELLHLCRNVPSWNSRRSRSLLFSTASDIQHHLFFWRGCMGSVSTASAEIVPTSGRSVALDTSILLDFLRGFQHNQDVWRLSAATQPHNKCCVHREYDFDNADNGILAMYALYRPEDRDEGYLQMS